MACSRQVFERGGHISARNFRSAAGKPFVESHMAAPDFTTRRALRGLTGVDAQSSIAVIFRVPAESPERILVKESLDQPRCVRGSTVHAAFRRLQLSNPPTLTKLGPRKCSEWCPNSRHQRSTETYYEFDC